jgi:hypothetical protein
MIFRLFRRRRSPAAGLLEAPLAGLERLREALPDAGLADVFIDLAARTGVDLGEVAERVFDRLGEVVTRAGSEAEELAEGDRARQLRALASRAAERADLAYRMAAERVLEALPESRRQRSQRGWILLSAGLGLAAGWALVYFFLSRPPAGSPDQRVSGPPDPEADALDSEAANPAIPVEPARRAIVPRSAPGVFGEIISRLTTARRAARAAQTSKERQLWREYHSGGS